jgi:hypothetical protein
VQILSGKLGQVFPEKSEMTRARLSRVGKSDVVCLRWRITKRTGAIHLTLYKKFCQKHFDYWKNLGWIEPTDEIEIVPNSQCESHMHDLERTREKVDFT